MNFFEFMAKFPTEDSVIKYLIAQKYGRSRPSCHHCGSAKTYENRSIRFWYCDDCCSTFSVLANTIFEKSSTDLRKWMYAIHLFLNSKKGISGYQLQREIGVTYKTAWRMLKLIREAMGKGQLEGCFEAIVEMDETYVGGKPRKENYRNDDDDKKPGNKRGRGTDKTPVVGMVDRKEKKVYAKVPKKDEMGRMLTGKELFSILREVCKHKNPETLITDQFRSYNYFERENVFRLKVDHSVLFADGDIHTNNIESFWAILKRGIYGIYHHVSVKYLQRYVDEFCFRYNNRDVKQSFDALTKLAVA